MPGLPGINHLDAVRALGKAGFHIARQSKHSQLKRRSPMAKFFTAHDRRIPQSPDESFPTPGFFPATAVLISVADPDTGVPNIIPLIGWGPLNRDPLMMGIAVCVREYNRDYYVRGSGKLLRRAMDFVLNIPTRDQKDIITRWRRAFTGERPVCR